MEITEVKVFPVSEEKLRAFVSIVVDSCFMVNDIKVIRGKDGLFISMPSRKKKSGDFKDVAHPLNNETRRMIEERILGEYERVLEERGEEPEVGRRLLRIDEEEEREEEPERRVEPVPPVRTPAPAPAERPMAASAADGAGEAPAAAREESEKEPSEGKSLEEIQEMHLRDSFWSVT
jgi:stage V sporulation protein G